MIPDCLPDHLRDAGATITRVSAGLSGAGVYRVEAAGNAYVLKIASDAEPLEAWRARIEIQHRASDARLAPAIIHVDEARRAVLSAFVADRSFAAFVMDPRTRDAALSLLGRTLRRVHSLPLPADARPGDPKAFLAATYAAVKANCAVPAFVDEAVERALALEAPACERAIVLSHNDVNPTNLVYDGERIVLLDWDTAGANDPLYDLAAIAVFMRMDEATCQKLLAAYDDAPLAAVPDRFTYNRTLIAALCGIALLHVAARNGHAGAAGDETMEGTASLEDVYLRMRTGELTAANAYGQWMLGLALVKASIEK